MTLKFNYYEKPCSPLSINASKILAVTNMRSRNSPEQTLDLEVLLQDETH